VSRLLASNKLIDAMAIPRSVAHALQLYMISTNNIKDIVEVMDSEMVFFFIKCLLEKHFGGLYIIKGKVELKRNGVMISISEVISKNGHHRVAGGIFVDVIHAVLKVALEIIETVPTSLQIGKAIDYGIVHMDSSGELLIKYYV